MHDFHSFKLIPPTMSTQVSAKHAETQSLWLIIKNIQEIQRPVPGITELP